MIRLSANSDKSIKEICSAANNGSEEAVAWIESNIGDRQVFELITSSCMFERCGPRARERIIESARNGNASALSALYRCSDKKYSTQICDIAIQSALNGDIAAVSFVKRCAENEYAPASMAMGRIYDEGIGVEQSYFTAVRWYAKVLTFEARNKVLDIAEKIDEPNAQIMGLCYEYAILGLKRAQKCLRRYCDMSVPGAKTVLRYYETNREKSSKDKLKDYHKIEILVIKAAIEDNSEVSIDFKKNLDSSELLSDVVIPSALSGKLGAARILLKIAENGNKEAINCLGSLYENGICFEQSDECAIYWYSKNQTAKSINKIIALMNPIDEPTDKVAKICYDLSSSGNEEAKECLIHYSESDPYSMYLLGLLYMREHEYALALNLICEAAESNCVQARNWLNGNPADSRHVTAWEEDYTRRILLIRSAFEGNDEAISTLKKYPEEGRTLPQEIIDSALEGNEIAISILEQFANYGYPKATITMGFLYENGVYFEQSETLALKWYSTIMTHESKFIIAEIKERKYGLNDEVLELYYELMSSHYKGVIERIRRYCEQSKPEAMYLMARFCVKKGQYKKAVELVRDSASLGYTPAREWLKRYSPDIGHLSKMNWNDVNW